MTREKMKERYERAKDAMEKAKAEMERYGHEIEESDKNEFWKIAQKHHISAEDLLVLIAAKDKENAALLKRTEGMRNESVPEGTDKEESGNGNK